MNQEQEKIEELTVEQPTEEKCNCENCECHHDKKKKKNKNKKEEELTLKIAELEKLNQELTDKVKLAQAELVNYRRRKDEETANMLKYSNQNLIMEILPIFRLRLFRRMKDIRKMTEPMSTWVMKSWRRWKLRQQ